MPVTFTLKTCWDCVTIYINDVIHIQIPTGLKVAVQTWVDTTDGFTKYCVEFVNSETGTIIVDAEYDTIEKWKEVLKIWDENRQKTRPKYLKKS